MEKLRIQNLTLSFFYVVILAVPIFWIIRGNVDSQKSLAEGRFLKAFPSIFVQNGSIKTNINQQNPDQSNYLFGQILGKSFQRNIEQAASDQFPFRFPGILVAKGVDRASISLAYAFLPDQAIPADMQSGLYVMRDGSRLLPAPSSFYSKSKIQLDKKAANLNSLIEANRDIHFYLFYHQKLSDSPYHPLNIYFKGADRGRTWNYFSGIAPKGLTISSMLLTSFEDENKYYFRTDHHMNVGGAVYAYNQIYDMLAKGYPDISPKLNTDNQLTFPNMDFLGSYARRSLYPIRPDEFSVPITSQSPFVVYKNGDEYNFIHHDEYLAGIYENVAYFNHYGQYYGNDSFPFVDFRSENGSTRSILVIGSSFCRPQLQLLAAHYQHVYYVDLRHNKDFSLARFIKNQPIQDVLFFTDDSILINNEIWTINP